MAVSEMNYVDIGGGITAHEFGSVSANNSKTITVSKPIKSLVMTDFSLNDLYSFSPEEDDSRYFYYDTNGVEYTNDVQDSGSARVRSISADKKTVKIYAANYSMLYSIYY